MIVNLDAAKLSAKSGKKQCGHQYRTWPWEFAVLQISKAASRLNLFRCACAQVPCLIYVVLITQCLDATELGIRQCPLVRDEKICHTIGHALTDRILLCHSLGQVHFGSRLRRFREVAGRIDSFDDIQSGPAHIVAVVS
jgi:hypothetical protein